MRKISKTRRIFSIILFIILLPFIVIYVIARFFVRRHQKAKFYEGDNIGRFQIKEKDETDIDLMKGYEFEELVKSVLFYLGFQARVTPKSKDFGADVEAVDQSGKKIIIQVKRFNKPVGAKSVQEVAAARMHYNADEAWVIASNFFTPQAETLARETDVRLIDRTEFLEMFFKAKSLLAEQERVQIETGTISFDGFGGNI